MNIRQEWLEVEEQEGIDGVHYYRESKENAKQGKVTWAIKRSLVRADLSGFNRALGMVERPQEVKE